jgi:hypothetical protein
MRWNLLLLLMVIVQAPAKLKVTHHKEQGGIIRQGGADFGDPDSRLAFASRNVSTAIMTPVASVQATSTPEERARWVEIMHRLESNPLDESANKDGDWAFARIDGAGDFHVVVCVPLVGEFIDLKYKYRLLMLRQYILASASFQIENPPRVGEEPDTNAMNLVAIRSVLKVYSAVLQRRPEAEWKPLDELVEQQSEGNLAGAVRKLCVDKDRQP